MNSTLLRHLLHQAAAVTALLLTLAVRPARGEAPDSPAARAQLAAYAQRVDAAAVDFAWPYLDSPDAALREAARRAIVRQPWAAWKERAIEEKSTWASLEALQALVEACPPTEARSLSPHLCEQITTLRFEHMDAAQQLAAIRLTRLVFVRLGPLSEDERHQMLDLWSHIEPLPEAAESAAALRRFLGSVRVRRS